MKKEQKHYFIVALVGLILFIPFLGQVHLFDWDEINFAESAREMMVSGNYFQVQVNFQPFWEKPPLFFWMQVLSMKAFGVNEFAARFPNAVCGIATLLVIFHIGRKLFSTRLGYFWVASFIGAFTPHLYFKSAIIDPTFNLFIFLGMYQIYRASLLQATKQRLGIYALAGMFLGLAVLTKGPAAAAVTLLCVGSFWVVNRFRFYFNVKEIILYTLCAIAVAFAWFGIETINNGFFFLREFITYQIDLFRNPVASHGQPFYYHPIVLLVGCFPISVIGFYMFKKNPAATQEQKVFAQWMLVLFWVVLILFSIVKTKIVHYSSLCYLPLTFLAAYTIENILGGQWQWRKWLTVPLLILGLALGAAFTLVPFIASNENLKAQLFPYIKDPFAVANFSRTVAWGGWEWLIGIVFITAIVLGTIWLYRQQLMKGFVTLLGGTMLSLQLFLYIVVPKIEQYSQGAAIQFWEGLQGKDVYVQPLGYDTYAHYYYARIRPWETNTSPEFANFIAENKEQYQQNAPTDWFDHLLRDWLVDGEIDKPGYFCCHMKKADEYAQRPGFIKIGEDGGFVFFKREAVK
jgi:4-amino-4-deoxy-L-arabinose transferase-like glycosyltransferase